MTSPPRPPRSDRFGIVVAVLGGIFVALAAVLVILLLGRGGGGTSTTGAADTTLAPTSTTAADTTLAPTSTSAAPTSTTTSSTTTTTTTSTTTTTTLPPFDGTLADKTGPVQGSPAGRLIGIREAAHSGFTRVVFDLPAGGIPGYWIGYTDATTLSANFYPISWATPYDPGIFDASGNHAVGEGSVVRVHDGGMGAGSGEWVFEIIVTSQKPFRVGTLDGPPRIFVDIAD